MSTIGMDVIFTQILPRLPAKSLMRFKCVAQSCKSEISSQHFAQLFLRYQSLYTDSKDLLVLSGDRRIICYDLDSTVTAKFTWDDQSSVCIVGSTNGLLCIITRGDIDYLTVLNPSTRMCQDIHFPNRGRYHNLGFAFDYGNLDYKIVYVSDHHDNSAIRTRITSVYSLNAKSWKIIKTELPTDSMEERQYGVLINHNLLHWIFWSPSLYKRKISCFNVCKNKWVYDVLFPRYHYEPPHMNYFLDFGVFDDCLFSSFNNLDNSCFDVWVMKEYGVQDSWVKLLSIPILNNFLGVVPVACRIGADEILIRKRHLSSLLWYSKIDGGLIEAEFVGAPDFSNFQHHMCRRSLVDLPGCKLLGDEESRML